MSLTSLNLNGPETQEAINKVASGEEKVAFGVDTEGGKVSFKKTWSNGFGLVAYAQKKWKGDVKAGVEGEINFK